MRLLLLPCIPFRGASFARDLQTWPNAEKHASWAASIQAVMADTKPFLALLRELYHATYVDESASTSDSKGMTQITLTTAMNLQHKGFAAVCVFSSSLLLFYRAIPLLSYSCLFSELEVACSYCTKVCSYFLYRDLRLNRPSVSPRGQDDRLWRYSRHPKISQPPQWRQGRRRTRHFS